MSGEHHSDSSSGFDTDSEQRENERNSDFDKQDIFGGKGLRGEEEHDSELEDLLELEKIERRRKRMQDKTSQRRTQRGMDTNETALEEEELEDDCSDGIDNEFAAQAGSLNMDRLKSIEMLIKKKRQKQAGQMRAKISDSLVNQVLLCTLINKPFIKETLQKEYQKQLDMDMDEINKVTMK